MPTVKRSKRRSAVSKRRRTYLTPRIVGPAYRARPLSLGVGRRASRRQSRGFVPMNTLSRRR